MELFMVDKLCRPRSIWYVRLLFETEIVAFSGRHAVSTVSNAKRRRSRDLWFTKSFFIRVSKPIKTFQRDLPLAELFYLPTYSKQIIESWYNILWPRACQNLDILYYIICIVYTRLQHSHSRIKRSSWIVLIVSTIVL